MCGINQTTTIHEIMRPLRGPSCDFVDSLLVCLCVGDSIMRLALKQWTLWLTAALLLALSACASATPAPAADPPGALVRLQRAENATGLPGDFTVFGNGNLQLYF